MGPTEPWHPKQWVWRGFERHSGLSESDLLNRIRSPQHPLRERTLESQRNAALQQGALLSWTQQESWLEKTGKAGQGLRGDRDLYHPCDVCLLSVLCERGLIEMPSAQRSPVRHCR